MNEDLRFREKYNKYYNDVRNYVRCLIWNAKNEQDIDMCVQDVFIITYRKFDEFVKMDEATARGWILKVAKNVTYNFNRKNTRRQKIEELVDNLSIEQLYETIVVEEKEESCIEEYDEIQLLYIIRDRLPEKYYCLFDYIFLDKLSDKQIATLMDISEEALRMRRVRLSKKMKKIINFVKKSVQNENNDINK